MRFLFCLIIMTSIALEHAYAYEGLSAVGGSSEVVPSEIQGVGVTEHLGEKIDLNLEFTNEEGQLVPLRTFFHQQRPVMMAMIYYNCPNLCNFQLNGLIEVLKGMKGRAGIDYELVAVSMEHREAPELAAAKKEKYMSALGQAGAEKGWHFLVGSEQNVKALAGQLGFQFKWDEALKQYAHAAATYILTPEGALSRYLYGIGFSPQTLRFSLIEASNGKIGSIVEQLTLFCFQFNPDKNKYTFYAYNIMRIGAAFTVLILLLFLVPVWLKEKKRKALGA